MLTVAKMDVRRRFFPLFFVIGSFIFACCSQMGLDVSQPAFSVHTVPKNEIWTFSDRSSFYDLEILDSLDYFNSKLVLLDETAYLVSWQPDSQRWIRWPVFQPTPSTFWTAKLSAYQLDGKKRKEIIINWTYSEGTSNINGGFSEKRKMLQVWNMDKVQNILSLLTEDHYSIWSNEEDETNSLNEENYHFKIEIDLQPNQMIIRDLIRVNYELEEPSVKEGIYYLHKGNWYFKNEAII